MNYAKIWTHVVFATKNTEHLISLSLESRLKDYLTQCFVELGCPVRIMNGMPDHLHVLFLLNPVKSIADVMRHIKGKSSQWVNQHSLSRSKFAWQVGYAAFTVSESQVKRVCEYIANQKQYHQVMSFQEEYEHLILLHGWELEVRSK